MPGFGQDQFGHHPFGHGSAEAPLKIQDIAYNPLLSGSTGQMIGYIEPPITEETLQLDMYRFILATIRKEDEKATLFLKRFLQGPQAIWEQIQERIFAIKDLWDIAEIEDDFLPYLQNIVGWTGDLQNITEALDTTTLRRLIATSVALWRQRGPEDALIDVLQLTTGAQARIWNWFDFRWILGETQLGEEHQGRDPWLIELPGPPDYDEYRSNLRIVDDGSLDHTLVVNLVKLMRACGERFEVSYIDFMDRFSVDGAGAQWVEIGSSVLDVSGGAASLTAAGAESVVATATGSGDWNKYVAFMRLRGTTSGAPEFGCGAYMDEDHQNGYLVALDIDSNYVRLYEVTAGAPSLLQSGSYFPYGTLYEDVYYGIRVHIEPQGSDNLIQIYIDGDLLIQETDSGRIKGTLSIWHEAGATVEVDEVEMFTIPLETELVDINS